MLSSIGGARLPVALSVLSLVCVALAGADDNSSCLSGDRMVSTPDLKDPSPENPPDWWVPMLCSLRASSKDSHLCGYALRFGPGTHVIAHSKAVKRIARTQRTSKRRAGYFLFWPGTTLDLTSPVLFDQFFVPDKRSNLTHNLKVYEVTTYNPTSGVQLVDEKYALKKTPVSLEDHSDDGMVKNCYVMTYAYIDWSVARPWFNQTKSQLKFVSVALNLCVGPLCYLYTDSKINTELCGLYANLGNVVVCGEPANLKVSFIIVAMGWSDPHNDTCTDMFRAVKAGHLCERLDTHAGYGHMTCL